MAYTPDLTAYRSEIQNYGTWTPALESAAKAYVASPEYQQRIAEAKQKYDRGMMTYFGFGGGENKPPFDPDNPLSPYAVNPYVKGSTWKDNVQTIQYIDDTSHTNAPYKESYGVGGFLGDLTKYAAIGGVAAGAGYVGGGALGLWGAPATAAAGTSGLTAAEAGMLGTEGFVPGAATFSPAELALGTSGASFTGGVGPMPGLIGGTGATAGAASGLSPITKLMLAQQGINAVKGIAGGGGTPTGGYGTGAEYGGAQTSGGLLNISQSPVPQYAMNKPTFNLAKQNKPKTWQEIAEETKQNVNAFPNWLA